MTAHSLPRTERLRTLRAERRQFERGESGFAGAKIADARKSKNKSYKEFGGRREKGGRKGGGKGS